MSLKKIPSKIDKRTYTRLSKLNAKYLKQEIEAVKQDLDLEADWLINDWDTSNKYMEASSKGHLATINDWQKEIRMAFRYFSSTKKKLEKAYNNGSKK